MKLLVDKGELSLPEDFSFEIDSNNAFFSDDGTSSVAATIPATPEDLAKLSQPGRPGRNARFVNLFPAILSNGVYRKKGTLVVNSVSKDGISCAIALEESDFYANYKDKNLKDLFSQKVLTTYTTPADWYDWLFQVYKCEVTDSDFRIIPVAVNYDDDGGSYQVNNEPDTSSSDDIRPLLHDARLVTEGDDTVHVPDGYGIAPFLKLYSFFETMFQLCGYTVGQDCFKTSDYLKDIILLHNCSDVICNGKIDYSDLVPNKKVSEILEWIEKKFHAEAIFYPATKTVDLVLLEDILSGSFDVDLSKKLCDQLTLTYSKSKRVVLKSDTKLDGAAPAASTLKALIEKYHYCKDFAVSAKPTLDNMGLAFYAATGAYYEIQTRFSDHLRRVSGSSRSGSSGDSETVSLWKYLGSNYFDYDQDNSDETEEISPADLMPPMVFVHGVLMPYIGDRKHRNTTYNDSAKDEDQDIIIIEYAGLSSKSEASEQSGSTEVVTRGNRRGGIRRVSSGNTIGGHYYYGTTQKYDNLGNLREGKLGLTNDALMEMFFKQYNKMLLNNLTQLSGKWDLGVKDLLDYKMYQLKIYNGQKLLPVSMKYEIGKHTACQEAKFYLVKDFADGISDSPAVEYSESPYKWQVNESQVKDKKAEIQANYSDKTIIAQYNDDYSAGKKNFFLAAPSAAGLKSALIERTVDFGYSYLTNHNQTSEFKVVETDTLYIWLESVSVS